MQSSGSVLSRVRRTIAERGLLVPGERVVVACSGGPDSVALVDVLARLSDTLAIDLLVASVNHGLRPEAVREVEEVRKFAGDLGVPFVGLDVRVGEGSSLQAEARRARYDALTGLARSARARSIAVGHTMDDQAETVLSRLLRGSGLEGLGAIAPRRKDGVVRPLIDCRRQAVHEYVRDRGLAVVADPSNRDRRFERVRIRQDVLPNLEQHQASVVAHLCGLSDDARAASRVLRAQGRTLLARSASPSGLDRQSLRRAPRATRRMGLRLWIESLPQEIRVSRRKLEALERLIDGSGHVRLSGGWLVDAQGQTLTLVFDPERVTRSARTKRIQIEKK